MSKQRIINCVGQLPYKIQLSEQDEEWMIGSHDRNSSLSASFQYLHDSDKYEQHIVGWTGEITRGRNGLSLFSGATTANENDNDKDNENEIENVNDDSSEATATNDQTADSLFFGRGVIEGHEADSDGSDADSGDDPFYLTDSQLDKLSNSLKEYSLDEKNELTLKISNIHPVWLLRRDQTRWRRYAENIIWPTFHYILKQVSEGEQENDWWYDYVKFNEAYANEVSKIYKKGDIIWVHDYYLLLLPQILRMRLNGGKDEENDLKICYFHHSPWPSNEYFRCLPRRKQILDGLVGADRICFQNDFFARHFVSSCKRLLDATSKKTKNKKNNDQYNITVYGGDVIVDSCAIGIDKENLLKDAFNKNIDSKVLSIKQAYQGRKIIIGKDYLNEVSGIIQKLRAFETFLEMNPNWIDKIVLIQVSIPFINKNLQSIIRLEQQVNDLVNTINSKFGTLNFSPVQHYYMKIPNDVYLSLMRSADVCLVTTVRDSVNVTAYQYVTLKSKISQLQCIGDPLILSEFSGSSTILKDAIIVNPWDSVAVAKSIKFALELSVDEKKNLQKKLTDEIPSIKEWTDNFLETFQEITDKTLNDSATGNKKTPALNRPVLLQNYKKAQRRLFLFDYDGTLTPIVQDPAAAIPSARLYSILTKLAQDPKNQIWIISGRDQQFLNKWLGSKLPQLGLSAEHGCFIKDVSQEDWTNLTDKYDMSWQKDVGDIMQEFTDKTPGSFIERKKVALTWHYRRAVPELGEYNAQELRNRLLKLTEDNDLEVMEGKANIEVRPSFVNKGEIVKRLVWNTHGTSPDLLKGANTSLHIDSMPDFILCLGDDFTDEDMFKQLNTIESHWSKKFHDSKNEWGHYGVYPVTVGSAAKKTVAKAHLTDPQQVLDTLGLLVGNVNIFQSAGTVDLDSRGHIKNSEASLKSEKASVAYHLKRNSSQQNVKAEK